jgi:hypothetical protein
MHRLVVVGLLSTVMMAGCGGDNSPLSSTGTSSTGGNTSTTSSVPAITGAPGTAVVAGQHYSFEPIVTTSDSSTLSFSIQNMPSWATFNTMTGQLSGTPTLAEVGTYAGIVIIVSDGTSQAALPAFAIAVTETAVGTATLSWTAPTENTNGSPLTDLAGYWISYGTSADNLTEKVQVDNPGIMTYVVSNLSPGTWFFSISAYSAADAISTPSAVATVTID